MKLLHRQNRLLVNIAVGFVVQRGDIVIIKADNVELPAPVSLKIDDEIIWSSDTGRTLDGTMVGDVVAEKKNISINWGLMPESDYLQIKSKLIAGFFPVTIHDDGADITITTYRGTLSKEVIGDIGDDLYWYRSVTVQIIQQ